MTVVRGVFGSRPSIAGVPSLVSRMRLAARRRPSWWRDGWDDQLFFVAVALVWTAWTWRRDKQIKQRLADVAVPNGIAVTALCFVLARQRSNARAWRRASGSLSEISRAMTAQRLETFPTGAAQSSSVGIGTFGRSDISTAAGDHTPQLQVRVADPATAGAEPTAQSDITDKRGDRRNIRASLVTDLIIVLVAAAVILSVLALTISK